MKALMRWIFLCVGSFALFAGVFLWGACDAMASAAPGPEPLGRLADEGGNAPTGLSEEVSPAGRAIRFYQRCISDLRRGRCRFEPSCSQYAMEAIKDRGLVLGTALAADRLMRCNSRAWRWYARNDKGRLVDSPGGEGWRKEPLRVPGWLLPPVERTAVPESLQGYADFADALEGENDCWRAATEYKRIAFLGESPDLAFWAQMRIGACYFRNEEWTESATEFVSAADLAPGSQARNAAWLAAASSHFNLGGYESCRQVLLEAPFDWSPRLGQSVAGEGGTTADSSGTYSSVTLEDWLGLAGLCAMALGDWDQAQSRFAEAAQRSSASPDRSRLLLLAERARDGAHLPRKNAGLAAAMSAVLPGSGQVYCGRYYDGFRHFMFNSLLISIVYGLVRDESYPGAYLVAGLALPFYLGNVAGAKKAAVWTNAARREAYLRDSAALTESTGE